MIFALALAVIAQADAQPLNLHLICTGAGQQEKPTSNSAYARDNAGNSATVTGNGSRTVAFEDQVRIDIAGDGGRIRVPQAMLPPIRGGKDGWFELRDVSATADEIRAIATINLLNKVKLRIDRLTGTATFTVKQGQFAGRCTPYDPGSVQRAF
ncbi:hypothetical protein ACWGNZ_07105 [Sphingomonas zeae]